MAKRRRRALGILAFWVIFLLLFWYAQSVLIAKEDSRTPENLLNSTITPYTNATRIRAYNHLPRDTVDIAFVGSSIVYCGVNPVLLYEEYGIASHNYAVGSATNANTHYLTSIVFERQHPAYVFLDTTRLYADFLTAGTGRLTAITPLNTEKVAFARSMGDFRSAVECLVPLFQCHQCWSELQPFDFAYAFVPPIDPFLGMTGMIRPAANGNELYERFSQPAISYADYTPEVKPVLTDTSKQQLADFQQLCLANGAQPVLITIPSVFGNEATKFQLELSAYAESISLPMFNFALNRHGLQLLPEDFADDHHLTVSGMNKFTRVLGKWLTENCTTPDRRGDVAYERYDQSVKTYHDATDAILREGGSCNAV